MSANELSPTVTLKQKTGLFSSRIDQEVVIYDDLHGLYFGLNSTASRIWDSLSTPKTLNAVTSEIEAQFDISSEDCLKQVRQLVENLAAKNLIEIIT